VKRRIQKSSVLVVLLLFCLVLVLLQLWLFVSVLEGIVAGRTRMAVPALFGSLVIFAINVWMLRGVYRLEGSD
jgi:hypothetical protein